jgi:ATP-dependent DNA ligase
MMLKDQVALVTGAGQAAEQHGLEGIVSKRAASAYQSGPSRDWVKIKTAGWRAANRERWRLFEKR